MRNWFHYKLAHGEFYSPFNMGDQYEYKVIGDGKKYPSPNEFYKALEENPSFSADRSTGLLHKNILEEDEFKWNKKVELPSGVYFYTNAGSPPRLVPFELRTDKGIVLPQFYDVVMRHLESFIANPDIYRDDGGLYKFALLMFGDPGNGKTTIIRHVIRDFMPKDTIVTFFNEMPHPEFLLNLRKEKRLKIIVFEELTNFTSFGRATESILSFLDGEFSFDNCIIFGTTNYPQQLPANLVDRPSRFDKLIKVDNLNKESRKLLLNFYLKRETTEKEIELTKDSSVAYIKEACLLHRKMNVSFEEAMKELKEHHNMASKEFDTRNPIGFR